MVVSNSSKTTTSGKQTRCVSPPVARRAVTPLAARAVTALSTLLSQGNSTYNFPQTLSQPFPINTSLCRSTEQISLFPQAVIDFCRWSGRFLRWHYLTNFYSTAPCFTQGRGQAACHSFILLFCSCLPGSVSQLCQGSSLLKHLEKKTVLNKPNVQKRTLKISQDWV